MELHEGLLCLQLMIHSILLAMERFEFQLLSCSFFFAKTQTGKILLNALLFLSSKLDHLHHNEKEHSCTNRYNVEGKGSKMIQHTGCCVVLTDNIWTKSNKWGKSNLDIQKKMFCMGFGICHWHDANIFGRLWHVLVRIIFRVLIIMIIMIDYSFTRQMKLELVG